MGDSGDYENDLFEDWKENSFHNCVICKMDSTNCEWYLTIKKEIVPICPWCEKDADDALWISKRLDDYPL